MEIESSCKDLQLLTIDNPFRRTDRTFRTTEWYHGITIQEVLDKFVSKDSFVRVYLNGNNIHKDNWNIICPRPGDMLTVVPEFHGGGNTGKMVLKAVLMIGIAIASFYTGGSAALIGAIGQTGASAVGASMMLIGGLLVNALLPAQMDTPKIGDNTDSAQYSWSPNNTQAQGVVIPKYYGVNKLYGNIISSYIENEGDDQYYTALVCLGMGPVKSLYGFMINDQPISRFEQVYITSRRGFIDQAVIKKVKQIKHYYPSSVLVEKDDNYIYTTTGDDFDGIEVDISFPQGVWKLEDEEDGGEITYNEVEYEVKVRKLGDTTWINIAGRKSETPSGWTYVQGGYWSLGKYEIEWDDRTGMSRRVWVEVQRGSTTLSAHDNGDDGAYPYEDCEWKWFEDGQYIYDPGGTPIWLDYTTVRHKSTKAVRKTHEYKVPDNAHGKYQVLVNRRTHDNTSRKVGDDMYFAGVREVLREAYTYPGQVLVAVRAKANEQLSGTLRLSCMTEGSIIRYYDSSEESWTIGYNNNPAWVAWDIVTQPVITGSGATGDPYEIDRYLGIHPDRLDQNKWKEWAVYCDAQVSDGTGNTERRVTFNGIFDYDSSLWESLLKVCQIGNAVPVWNGSKLTIAIDKEVTGTLPLWSVGDITEGSFVENFLPMEERSTEIEVNFVNQAMDYERDKLTVYQPSVDSNGFRSTIDLFGVTKPTEAWRAAMRRLMNNKYVTRSVTVKKDIEALNATIGDVINIQHDVPSWGVGGRIVSATSGTVTFDQEVTILAGLTYKVIVRLSTDVVQERTVSTGAGTYTTVSVTSNFSPVPAQYDSYAFGQIDTLVKPFRIVGLKRNNDLTFDVEATEYRPECYQYESTIPAIDSRTTKALLAIQPKDVVLDEMDYMHPEDGRRSKGIAIDFVPSDDPGYSYVEIWHKLGPLNSDRDWLFDGTSNGTSFEILGLTAKTRYVVALVPVTTTGRKLWIGYCDKHEIKLHDYRDVIVFRRDSAPTKRMMTGDRWIDTDDSGKMYWYDGSAWVAMVIPDVTGLVTADGNNEFWGRSCEIVWDVTDITTGEVPPYDWIDHYKIVVKTPGGITLRTDLRNKPKYVYTFDKNKSDHAKLETPVGPQPSIVFRVWAVDRYGNTSTNYVEMTATAPVPADVSPSDIIIENSTGDDRTRKNATTEISWTDQCTDENKMTLTRLNNYIVRVYTSASVFKRRFVLGPKKLHFEISPHLNEQIFGEPTAGYKIGIVVQDVFMQNSTPQLLDVGISSVPTVQNIALKDGGTIFTERSFTVVWDNVLSTDFPYSRFSHYVVRVLDYTDDTVVRTEKTDKSEVFNYEFYKNQKDFIFASPIVKIGVKAVDRHGYSGVEAFQTFTASTPINVTNLKIINKPVGLNDSHITPNIELMWDNVIGVNFKKTKFSNYNVRVYTSGTFDNPKRTESTGEVERFRYTRHMAEDDFGGIPTGSAYFKVTTVDVFGQESNGVWIASWGPAGQTVSNLQVKGGGTTFITRDCDIVWDNIVSATFPDSIFSHYKVTVTSGGIERRIAKVGKNEWYTYKKSQNWKDTSGSPARIITFKVQVVDIYGTTDTGATLTATNAAPALSSLTATVKLKGVVAKWAWTDAEDIQKFLIYCDANADPSTLVAKVSGDADHKFIPLDSGTYYLKIVPYDVFGAGTASTTSSFDVGNIPVTDTDADKSSDNIAGVNVVSRGHAQKTGTGSYSTTVPFWSETLYNDGQSGQAIDNGIEPGDVVSFQAQGYLQYNNYSDLELRLYWETWNGVAFVVFDSESITWTAEVNYIRKVLENITIPVNDSATPTPNPIARIRIAAYKITHNTGNVYIKKIKAEIGPKASVYRRPITFDSLISNNTTTTASTYDSVSLRGEYGLYLLRSSIPGDDPYGYGARRIGFTLDGVPVTTLDCFKDTSRTPNRCQMNLWNVADAFLDGYVNLGGSAPYVNTVNLISDSTSDTAKLYMKVSVNDTDIGFIYLYTSGSSTAYCRFNGFSTVGFNSPTNIIIGDYTEPTDGTQMLAVLTGTAPSTAPSGNRFYMYSSNSGLSGAGHCPTFMTSTGYVVKLFRGLAVTSPTATTASLKIAVDEIITRLEGFGLLAAN